MLKKIITYFILGIITAIFAAYFYFASMLTAKGKPDEICNSISVTVLDSAINSFVSVSEVREILTDSKSDPIGMNVEAINLYELEEMLNGRSAIRRSDVAVDRNGSIYVSITQRRPVLRIETANGGFYVDDTQYVFPLIRTFTSYVPIVSGNIPIKLEEGYRGTVDKEDTKWMNNIIRFGDYLDNHEFWNAQIQQIYIDERGDIILYTRVGDQSIIFGSFDNIGYKFAKLDSFYQSIIPDRDWNRYESVNLKYSDQIVCKKKKDYNKHNTI